MDLSGLRLVPYLELSKVAEAAGFRWARREGSHNTFRNAEGHIVVIPDHGHQVIVRPLLRKILRDLGLSVEEYHRMLDQL
jgi:predicted RNA binding protein YcfA (HicA-like mRNA interferase family)